MFKNFVSCGFVIFALSACGGSGAGGGGTPPPVGDVHDLNIGSIGGAVAETGLDFADGTAQTLPLSTDLTVRLARFETDHGTGQSRIVVTDETFTTSATSQILNFTTTFRGETITLVYDGGIGESVGTLANGQELFGYLNFDGNAVSVINIYTYDDAPLNGFDSEGSLVIGFETAPGSLPTNTGTVAYTGNLFGFANVYSTGGSLIEQEVQLTGPVAFQVAFSDTRLDGEITLIATGATGTYVNDVFLLKEADIVGNGFGTTAPDMQTCGSDCTSATTVGGAFFGAGAQELAGQVAMDVTDTTIATRVVGTAAYIADGSP